MSEYSGVTNWEPLRKAYFIKTKTKNKRSSNVRLRKKNS